MRRVTPLLLQLVLVAGAAAVVWAFATSRLSAAAWHVPSSYSVDALEFLGRLKASEEGGLRFYSDSRIARLGAPFVADWKAYPMPDAPLFIALGYVARGVGLMVASNLALIIAHMLAAVSFYGCSRWLRHDRAWAFVGALLFSASFFNLFRALQHFSFTLSYVVPPALLSCWLIGASTRLFSGHQAGRWFCLATAVLLGIGNPYYAFLYCQLLLLAVLYQWFTRRRSDNIALGILSLAVCAVVTLLTNLHAFLARPAGEGAMLSLNRNYAGTELYALQLIQLFIPPPFHSWRPFAEIGTRYGRETMLRGELFAPYLGVIALGALCALAVGFIIRLARGRGSLRPAYAPTVLWIVLFGSVGGLNSFLGFAGIDVFRATNRYSVFILAAALLYLTHELTRLTQSRPALKYALAAIITVVGLWDQMPPRPAKRDIAALGQQIDADAKFTAALEASLPAGAMVFQLPATPFPEQPPMLGMTDYQHFRPYLYSHTLRFSYGSYVATPAAQWAKWIEQQPAPKMVDELQRAGFAALYVDRRAYADRAEKLTTALVSAGAVPLVASYDVGCWRLAPAHVPQLPELENPRFREPWAPQANRAETGPGVYVKSGWFGLEHSEAATWRWAGPHATLILWHDQHQPARARLHLQASALKPGTLRVELNGTTVLTETLQPKPVPIDTVISLAPGANELRWTFSEPGQAPSDTDQRLLAVKVQNLALGYVP